ncbi:MAG: hypothetical protein QOG84_635 [Sphingomonadales bacterium]|nr:hypothetical protein [Sphingomonadales bacterium]
MSRRTSKKQKLSIMVSSSVYGYEDLLDQIFAVLNRFGYDVWMSHRGTVEVRSNDHTFDSSLQAVEKCDLFLGIIFPRYGSGLAKGELSITHKEILRAIELNKPRWFLAHEYVVFARQLLRGLGHDTPSKRQALAFTGAGTLRDLRVVDMYDAASREEIEEVLDRRGNWVQKFGSSDEALLFTTAQFHRYREIEQYLTENFAEPASVQEAIAAKRNEQ